MPSDQPHGVRLPHLVRLVVLDVDGTLLRADGTLSTANAEAVVATEAAGVRVMLATGKTAASVLAHHRRMGLTTPIVCSQGAVVAEADGTIRSSRFVAPDSVRRGLALADRLGIETFVYAGATVYASRDTPYARRLGGQYEEPMTVVDDLVTVALAAGANKLLLHVPGELTGDDRARLSDALSPGTRLVQAVAESIEVLPAGVSKGATVGDVIPDLGFAFDDVLAIGDGENDLELLAASGCAVAVGNAVTALLTLADHVVATNDDDGVAEALERFVLAGRTSAVARSRAVDR